MPREISSITKRDKDFMALRDKILKKIKSRKDFIAFKNYLNDYYQIEKSSGKVIG